MGASHRPGHQTCRRLSSNQLRHILILIVHLKLEFLRAWVFLIMHLGAASALPGFNDGH